jgi:glutathione S-transferase
MDALDNWLAEHEFVCGERFTMADVYVGSQVDWGLLFGYLPERPAFLAYADRFRARDAYQAGKAIDNAMIAEMQAGEQN